MVAFGSVQMTNEIGLAFSHPIERSVASGISVDDQDVDRISLRDHIAVSYTHLTLPTNREV